MDDLCYLSAVEALRMFRSGQLSPVELMEAVIARAGQVEPSINAFADTHYESAMEQARAAEAAYAKRDAAPRALEGIPVAVKEEASIKGQKNTLGSLALRDVVADHTAVFVQRILDSGGIVHARTTTPEFSCMPVTWSKLWGVTRNPWNVDFSPGGSSGGSCASLAAGSTTLATGSDIGGSIRIPASFCGVVGFKPPYGRVPEVEIFNLDHYCHEGPLARTVDDCALLENVIAGPHPSDVASLRPKVEIPDEQPGINGMRIALSTDLGCYVVDEDVIANTRAAGDRLRAAGATVEEVSLPWSRETIRRAARIHFGMIFAPSLKELYDRAGDQFTSYARRFYEDSNRIAKDAFVDGLLLEGQLYEPLGEILERYDALICPTFAVPALRADYDNEPTMINGQLIDEPLDVLMTVPFNIASRCPVISVPSGRARNGVPTGLSIVGKTYDDLTAFQIARAYEAIQPWLDVPERRPAIQAALTT
jgi:Asp-tRNA(Asn)/Glu-tRNA(Gln) amidotransferase A subunit family amidase